MSVADPPKNDGLGIGESETGLSRASTSTMPVDSKTKTQAMDSKAKDKNNAKVTFADFALRFRQNQQKRSQRRRLEHRLRATKVSVGVSARLVRIGAGVQRGLVECLKQDDKINFVALYHTLYEIQEGCESSLRRQLQRYDSLDELPPTLSPEPEVDRSSSVDFFHQLGPQARGDLLDILHLARTDSQFLFERLAALTSGQLAGLTASASALDAGDPVFPSMSPSRSQISSRRGSTSSVPYKDQAFAFERTDPLSALLFNVYPAPLDSDVPESRLRLDVWSSVCARLIAHGGSRYYPLVGHILSSWTMSSNWRARAKFELYLMDILQTGAFLLENINTPAGMNVDFEPPDPMRTDVAEEFFASSVNALFSLLDDPDAGFPRAVMEFGTAVLDKLGDADQRGRFMEYFFVQWFFAKFLYGALTYPEVCSQQLTGGY